MVYPDGTSPEGSVMRIASLLTKELKINAESQFIGQNAATGSPADVKAFVEAYLQARTVRTNTDNLILNFVNVSASLQGTDYYVSFGFTPNGPVNRMFFTALMLNVSLSA